MKRTIVIGAILVAMAFAAGMGAAVGDQVIGANAGVIILKPSPGTTITSCPAANAGPDLCVAANGIYFSNGVTRVVVGAGGTVNNLTIVAGATTKTCQLGNAACTVTISAAAPADPPPAITVGVN